MNKLQTPEKENGSSCCGPTCCGGQGKAQATDNVVSAVKEKYGDAAKSRLSMLRSITDCLRLKLVRCWGIW